MVFRRLQFGSHCTKWFETHAMVHRDMVWRGIVGIGVEGCSEHYCSVAEIVIVQPQDVISNFHLTEGTLQNKFIFVWKIGCNFCQLFSDILMSTFSCIQNRWHIKFSLCNASLFHIYVGMVIERQCIYDMVPRKTGALLV